MLGAVFVLAGCGADGATGDASEQAATATATPARDGTESASADAKRSAVPGDGTASAVPRYTREQIAEALGVTAGHDRNGVPNSDLRTGCFAKRIFITPEDNMAAHQEIGDPVATDPSGEVGAWVGTYEGVSERRCLRLFERRLAELG